MKPTRIIASLVAVLAFPAVRQQSSVCSLLTAAEIEAVTGAKAGDPQPGDAMIPSSTANGQMRMCMWGVAAQIGQMTLSTGVLPPGMSATALAKKNAGTDALKGAKYTVVEKDYGTVWCSIMTPPASDKDGPILTTCAGGAKGRVVSLTYMSAKKKLAFDDTKALLEKAMSRQR